MIKRCHALLVAACLTLAADAANAADAATAGAGQAQARGYDYPTQGRVEYVLTCIEDNGRDFVNVYKCSCVIDRIAAVLPYDDFVEQSTFSKYATLGGEGGSEFRVDRAKDEVKKFRALQATAYHACGLGPQSAGTAK